MMDGGTRSFHSAVDWWYYAGLALIAAVLLINVWSGKHSTTGMGMVVVLGLGLPIWIIFSTRYDVDETELLVVSGPFRWRIPREDVRAVRPSRSLIASPALSLNRLEISYGQNRSLLVSPADREGFAQALGVELHD